MLAAALGAAVRPHTAREVGWHAVALTPAAARDPLWTGVSSPFTAFHWHGDTFDLPGGSTLLASSAAYRLQAFRHGTAYGLQFHLEVDEVKVREMAEVCPGELVEAGLSVEGVVRQAADYLPAMSQVAAAVFGRWAGLLVAGA